MKKQGFTLIEVLAVIVILSLLTLIIGKGVTKTVSYTKVKLSSIQEKLLLDAGEIWVSDNLNQIIDNSCTFVSIKELNDLGIIDSLEQFDDNIDIENYYVKICSKENDSGEQKLDYSFYDANEYAGCYAYTTSNNEVEITDYYDNIDNDFSNDVCPRDVAIPSKINGNSVTNIGEYAFNRSSLTSLTIPDSVTSIGEFAFYSSELTSLTIPDSVTSIGDSVFYSSQLESITLGNSVTNIGEAAFYSSHLTSLVIPNSVTNIDDHAFFSSQLTSLTLGSSVTSIGNGAFYDSLLTSLTIPNNVTNIGDSAFHSSGLTSLILGNSITSIGWGAFKNSQLTSLEIPNSVTSIGDWAFENSQLTSVRISRNKDTNILGVGTFGWASGYSNDNICWNDYCPE